MSPRTVPIYAMFLGLALPCRGEQDPSLVAYYRFEEGPGNAPRQVKDFSGHGNDGKLVGAEYVKLSKGGGFALKFDTPGAYVDCGNDPSLDLRRALTIELWFYPESLIRAGETGLVGKDLGSFMLSFTGGCWFYATTGSTRNACSASAPPKKWTHIVATFDGKHAKIYSDGRLQKAVESPAPAINRGGNLYLRYPIVWGGKIKPPFRCMMDEVRIYNRALSADEIMTHYRREARPRGIDVTWFDQVKLETVVLPEASLLAVMADFSQMGTLPAGSVLKLELRDAAGRKVLARHRVADLPASRKLDWTLSTKGLRPGDYELRAVVVKGDVPIGKASSIRTRIVREKPAWAAAYDQTRVLNNFVAELLNLQDLPDRPDARYRFTNPRDGWVLIRSKATTAGSGEVAVSLESPGGDDRVSAHTGRTSGVLEAMRYLPGGMHQLRVRSRGGARLSSLVVRAIPEIIHAGLGYEPCPWLKSYGPYDWKYLETTGILSGTNVILERAAKPQYAENLTAWRKQGKKVLSYYNLHGLSPKGRRITPEAAFAAWTGTSGFQSVGYHGIMVDEFPYTCSPEEYASLADAVRRIAKTPKYRGRFFYPYCNVMYPSPHTTAFLKAVLDSGNRWAEEKYLVEPPTEQAAETLLDWKLRHTILSYRRAIPDCTKDLMIAVGYMSAPPETLDVDPAVNYKVFLEMQMNLLANDPVFFGIYGLQWYHPAYADEEIMRWSARLVRHYCLEGRRQRLSKDPYRLAHLVNPDFQDGLTGWTVEPAEADAISIKRAPGYGWLQGRFSQKGRGDTLLVTRRSPKAPNRFSQPIRGLTPGRLYSLKMFITDYGEIVAEKSLKRDHAATVTIDGAEILPDKSFRELFNSGLAGHSYRGFNRKNPLYITYCRYVFRATAPTAALVVTDWTSDQKPGGPIGRQLGFNFIQVEPYLGD